VTGDPQSQEAFAAKWLDRWPEWRVAGVFVPAPQRERAVAWFALRQELLDAAWGGSDPRPGEAKLAWWAEELQGWSQGRRRHPLGQTLQRAPAPWLRVASGAAALAATREPAAGIEQARSRMEPFAQAVVEAEAALFGTDAMASIEGAVTGLLCEQVFLQADAAVPLQVRARLGGTLAGQAMAQGWASDLLQAWPAPSGSRPGRILAALQRRRLQAFVAGRPPADRTSPWMALWTAWRAARG
jgi:hypothetical protein